MSSALRLWGVRALGGERVVVVSARNALAARTRVSESSLVPLRKLVAEPELEPVPRRHFRCGSVGVDVLWSHRERRWHAGVSFVGNSRYVQVDESVPKPPSKDCHLLAAERAIELLREADDLDDSLLLWREGSERLHVVEAKQAIAASVLPVHRVMAR